MHLLPDELQAQFASLRVLLIDDEPFIRKVVRTLLATMGVRHIFEASDGAAGLDGILTTTPDIVIVDWEMPGVDGPSFVRHVRSPGHFPMPDVPIIMLTAHNERSCVLEAIKLGVHEYLLKPVSSVSLQTRIAAILTNPRPMIRKAGYYGPMPRKPSTFRPERDGQHEVTMVQ